MILLPAQGKPEPSGRWGATLSLVARGRNTLLLPCHACQLSRAEIVCLEEAYHVTKPSGRGLLQHPGPAAGAEQLQLILQSAKVHSKLWAHARGQHQSGTDTSTAIQVVWVLTAQHSSPASRLQIHHPSSISLTAHTSHSYPAASMHKHAISRPCTAAQTQTGTKQTLGRGPQMSVINHGFEQATCGLLHVLTPLSLALALQP